MGGEERGGKGREGGERRGRRICGGGGGDASVCRTTGKWRHVSVCGRTGERAGEMDMVMVCGSREDNVECTGVGENVLELKRGERDQESG